jgi:hypothetical protein
MLRDEEIERSVGLQYEGKGGKRWNSTEDRIKRRHRTGCQAFRTTRRLAKDWLGHQKEHWKEEALLLIKLIPRNASSERPGNGKRRDEPGIVLNFVSSR